MFIIFFLNVLIYLPNCPGEFDIGRKGIPPSQPVLNFTVTSTQFLKDKIGT